jgi:hypothetical protein
MSFLFWTFQHVINIIIKCTTVIATSLLSLWLPSSKLLQSCVLGKGSLLVAYKLEFLT